MANGKIIGIRKYNTQIVGGGIKGGQGFQRTPFGYFNGHGAFCSYPEKHIVLDVLVFGAHPSRQEVDITGIVYHASGRSRITDKYLETFWRNNGHRVISLCWAGDGWQLANPSEVAF